MLPVIRRSEIDLLRCWTVTLGDRCLLNYTRPCYSTQDSNGFQSVYVTFQTSIIWNECHGRCKFTKPVKSSTFYQQGVTLQYSDPFHRLITQSLVNCIIIKTFINESAY